MYEIGPRLSRREVPPRMITDSNQVCMAKMIDRRVQEANKRNRDENLRAAKSLTTAALPKKLRFEGQIQASSC
jgi:hypothetical protein